MHVFLILFALMMAAVRSEDTCPMRLPQNEQPGSLCDYQRKTGLNASRKTFSTQKVIPHLAYNKLGMYSSEYLVFLKSNPFLAKHAKLYGTIVKFFKTVVPKAYLKATRGKNQTMTFEDFVAIRQFYTNHTGLSLNPLLALFIKYPSSLEPFQSKVTDWISDRFFAEQRLAGFNPMNIQKVTLSNSVGMHFNRLKEMLNTQFDLIGAVHDVLGDVTDETTLKQAIEEGHLFVVYYPLCDNVPTMPDLTDNDPKRKMWEFKSPIAIFASRKDNAEVTPVAIQMDSQKDSPVFTPQDCDNWMLAKLNFHVTDLVYSQAVEHFSKAHMIGEVLCLGIERHLSTRHPLYDIMRFHCRGVFTTNTLESQVLLANGDDLDHLVPSGNEGIVYLVRKSAERIDWHDLDPVNNLKRRGVDDKKRLLYFPYRDDGLVIYNLLKNMVKDYVNSFYPSCKSVLDDVEVQNFAEEISKDGKGGLRGFPARFKSKKSLIETFSLVIWLLTAQHAAVSYPFSDYGSYVPNVSAKLYDVQGVPADVFTAKRLENRKTSMFQMRFSVTLGTFRMDRLLDYGSHLKTQKGRDVIDRYKQNLETVVEPKLIKRNGERLEKGHLTYPYMQPKWLPNGIQA